MDITSRPEPFLSSSIWLLNSIQVVVVFRVKERCERSWNDRFKESFATVDGLSRLIPKTKRSISYLPPASSSRTLMAGSSESRAAKTQPEVPKGACNFRGCAARGRECCSHLLRQSRRQTPDLIHPHRHSHPPFVRPPLGLSCILC